MSEIVSTRLRYVKSKNPDKILGWVNGLPFKIEIKGNPVRAGSFWFLYFIPPDNENESYWKFIPKMPRGLDLDAGELR